jgi:hypothetical protein
MLMAVSITNKGNIMNVENLIYKMLTENTGMAICDSGGTNGRHWQRNKNRTIDDFRSDAPCTLEISKWERDGKVSYDGYVNISLFHHLKRILELDGLCNEFNSLECGNWNGEFYGTDQGQCDWLLDNGFTPKGDGFNSYNWTANYSQDIQGQFLTSDNGDLYVLLQIHNGADARGGYTDAKLFKLDAYEDYALFDENSMFWVDDGTEDGITLDWMGSEFINRDGRSPDDDEFARFYDASKGELVTGDLMECCY